MTQLNWKHSGLRQTNRIIGGSVKFCSALILVLILPALALGYEPSSPTSGPSDKVPQELENVGVTERLGEKLDPNLQFTNDLGQTVTLGQYFGGTKPVVMAMIYYNCPSLCNFQLNGLLDTVKKMKGRAGQDYDLVAVSMDHTETAAVASAKKANYLKVLNQPGAEAGWHFLVGDEANVGALAQQLGFQFKWNEVRKEFAHSAVTYIVTPGGVISRYLHGIEFAPETLRMALVEASDGHIGNIIEQFVLFCFQFNPAKNKYTLYAFNIMRVGAALTVLLLAVFLIPIWLRERQRRAIGA
jgi:protein SCO1/2